MTIEKPPATAPDRIGPGRLLLVAGPSGAGKDALIAGAKAACDGDPSFVFPRRVVTRKATESEEHDTLDDAAFDRAVATGGFALRWQAHGLKYGIPRSIDDDIRAGRTVVCNVSRGIVADARARYAHVGVVLITAPVEVLAARLAKRRRASDSSVAERIKRSEVYAGFEADHTIDNSGTLDDGVRQLLAAIKAEAPAGKRS